MVARNWISKRSSRRSARRALALAALIAITGCQRSDPAPEASATPEVAEHSPSSTTTAAKSLSALGRADILAAVAAAADEVAAGNPLPQSNLELSDRSFELTLPISCEDGIIGNWGSSRYDPLSKVLRVTFSRHSWGTETLFTELADGHAFETAEGFWIERPWTRSEKCPRTRNSKRSPDTADDVGVVKNDAAAPVSARSEQGLALVQYFTSDAPRTLLRGKRPYAYTAKLTEEAAATSRALRIRIQGRITGYADGQPVHCVSRQTSQPPTCAVAVEFGKIALENAVTGETLADWEN